MSLEKLTQAVGSQGSLCRKPCAGPPGIATTHESLYEAGKDCPNCNGTGTVHDTEHPLFVALWEPCPCTVADVGSSYLPYEEHPLTCKRCYIRGRHTGGDCDCHGTNYVPRPLAEAALGLLSYARRRHGLTLTLYVDGTCRAQLHSHLPFAEWAGGPIEAVAAAVLVHEKAQEEEADT